MKISIIGPGAIGLLFAGKLQKTNNEVILIDHRKDRAALMNKEGIVFESSEDNYTFKVPVETDINKAADSDLVVIAVKAYHTEDVARSLHSINYKGYALTLQNGYGNTDILKDYIPEKKIIAGITSEGANLKDYRHVKHAGRGKTSFGFLSDNQRENRVLPDISGTLDDAGFETDVSHDTRSLIWSKLIINVGINALTAILKVQNGRLTESEDSRSLMHDLVNEAVLVSEKTGIKLPYSDPLKKVEEVCRLTAENYSSMFQDVKYSRKTEIDFINGAVVSEGEKTGVECPLNKSITNIIHALESFSKQ
jgi:2-dehydropantoate 2-reductase